MDDLERTESAGKMEQRVSFSVFPRGCYLTVSPNGQPQWTSATFPLAFAQLCLTFLDSIVQGPVKTFKLVCLSDKE